MQELKKLLENNRAWAAGVKEADPDFFERLAAQQSPSFLWIGCSDSRVPANQIVGLQPGEVFVHRNVANVVIHTDLNCLSVLQYAIEVLGVRHIIVCGHYGCGGVLAAMESRQFGLIDNWLRAIKDVYRSNEAALARISDPVQRQRLLCRLHVKQQVANVAHTTIVQNAWDRGQAVSVQAWIYDIHDGLIDDLGLSVEGPNQVPEIYRMVDAGVASDAAKR
ncbi:MAG TPA: carbonate dehydratase [Myxococcota bacterium]|jgi:carbonic anhydrase|nr:carbonate dehydratase [Myxococcota bacterium]